MPIPDGTPPPVGPRGLAIRAAIQGLDAYAAGRPVNACPYGEARPFTRRAWLAGYAQGARDAGVTMPAEEVDEAAPWPADTPD